MRIHNKKKENVVERSALTNMTSGNVGMST